MFRLAIKESLDKKFKKLQKKDKEMLLLIDRKVKDIIEDPFRFKPMKKIILSLCSTSITTTMFIKRTKHREPCLA